MQGCTNATLRTQALVVNEIHLGMGSGSLKDGQVDQMSGVTSQTLSFKEGDGRGDYVSEDTKRLESSSSGLASLSPISTSEGISLFGQSPSEQESLQASLDVDDVVEGPNDLKKKGQNEQVSPYRGERHDPHQTKTLR